MAPPGGADMGDASFNTQNAFGTQPPRPAPPRPANDELKIIGTNRLEPVLAGNTKRAELRPQAQRAQDRTYFALMNMLQKSGHQLQPPPAKSAPSPAENAPSPQTIHQHPPQPTDETSQDPIVVSHPAQTDKRERQSPVAAEQVETPRRQARPRVHRLDKLAAECSWMKGFHFTRESTIVPKDQASILNKPESWHKPQPGYRFPPANIPMAIFTTLGRLADEKAALDASYDSDNMDVDPTPDSYPTTGEQRSLPVTQVERDDDPSTSVVSWSPSPVLSPQRPAGRHNDLPPDSSNDSPEAVRHVQLAARLPSLPPDSSNDASMDLSPLPDSRIHQLQEQPQQTQESGPMDSSRHVMSEAPRSSPPVIDLLSSDNEMEMAVPHALGEDSVAKAKSVVQVKRTPYAKGRNGQTAYPLPPTLHKQTSYNGLQNISSASVIHDTCDVANTPATTQGRDDGKACLLASAQAQPLPMTSPRNKDSSQAMGARILNKESPLRQPAPVPSPSPARILSKGGSGSREQPASPKPAYTTLPMRRAISPPPSSPFKRKLDDSPSKIAKRKAKRRGIKIVGFGDTPEKAMLKQEEDVEMGAISEAEAVSARDDMSPRHRSLYDTPPVEKRPVEHPAPAVASTPLRRPSAATTPIPIGAQTGSDHDSIHPTTDPTHPQPIFQHFKAAYPEYTGDEKHFTAQCKQMLDLDSEDKMVPKWQWDDYLIRNRTDYKDYVMQCLDQGENFEPHYRFYKDNIRDTIFVEGILGSREALTMALDELGAISAHASLPAPPQPQPKRSARASLPWSPNVPHHRPTVATPRYSLPARSDAPPSTTPAPHKPREQQTPAPRPNLLARQSADKTPPTTGTGDAFRDYVFAAMRTTSWTGSTRVSSSARRGE
jgi:hypothetical protein